MRRRREWKKCKELTALFQTSINVSTRSWRVSSVPLIALDFSIADVEDAVGEPRHLLGVSDEDDRVAAGVNFQEETEDFICGGAVKVARGLIGEHDLRLCRKGAGDGDALALATGELRGLMVGPLQYTHGLERSGGPRSSFSWRYAAVDQGELDIGERCGPWQEVDRLEDKSDFTITYQGEVALAEMANVAAGELVGSRGRVVETAENIHQCRLSRAGGTHDG